MKAVQLTLLALLTFLSISLEAQSPKKYRVQYNISQKPEDFLGDLKLSMNSGDGPVDLKKISKSHLLNSADKPINLTFTPSKQEIEPFSLILPPPIKAKDKFQTLVPITTHNDNLIIDANLNIELKRSGSSVSTVVYNIELEQK